MALITCPSCKKRVSNLQTECPHCHVALKGSGEGLTVSQAQRRIARKRRSRLQMLAYASLFVFVAGVTWIWFGSGGNPANASEISVFVTVGGAVAYVVIRVIMLWPKIKKSVM